MRSRSRIFLQCSDEPRTRPDAELVEHARAVVLDRSDGEMKDGSNLGVRVTDRQECCDLAFSGGEMVRPLFSS